MPEDYVAVNRQFMLWDKTIRLWVRRLPLNCLGMLLPIFALPIILCASISILIAVLRSLQLNELLGFLAKMNVLGQRRVFRTQRGYIGLAPQLTQRGDCIALFHGGSLPLSSEQRNPDGG